MKRLRENKAQVEPVSAQANVAVHVFVPSVTVPDTVPPAPTGTQPGKANEPMRVW